jgi:hypothetical protein
MRGSLVHRVRNKCNRKYCGCIEPALASRAEAARLALHEAEEPLLSLAVWPGDGQSVDLIFTPPSDRHMETVPLYPTWLYQSGDPESPRTFFDSDARNTLVTLWINLIVSASLVLLHVPQFIRA